MSNGIIETSDGTGRGILSCMRDAGWTVVCHNDYRLNGKGHTFWSFARGDRYVKGEGETDREALQQCADAADRIGKEVELRPVVRWFAEQMELALRANDHKGGWHNDFPENLYYRIVDESDELHAALNVEDENEASVPPDPQRVVRESVDVANMSMMVADHFRAGGPSKDQGVTLHATQGAEENEDRG